MTKLLLYDTSNIFKASIQLEGDFMIAYSLRLWEINDSKNKLVEEIRGSCSNFSCREINYRMPKLSINKFNYFLELDSNITTNHAMSKYCIKLAIEQESNRGDISFIGEQVKCGELGFSGGGKYVNLAIISNLI